MGSTGFLVSQPCLMAKLKRVESSRLRLFHDVGWPEWQVFRASRSMLVVMAAQGVMTRSGHRRERRERRVLREVMVTRLLCSLVEAAAAARSRRVGDRSASGGAIPCPSSKSVDSFATDPARFTRAT